MNYLATQIITYFARIVFSGLIATGVVGGGLRVRDFNSTGRESATSYVVHDYLNVFLTGTGSTSIKYPVACVANPLARLGTGTGVVRRVDLMLGNNPAGLGFDVGFVKSCGDAGGSGQTLIDNSNTGTGTFSSYTTGTASWNGVDYIKVTTRGNLTSSFTGRLRIEYEDLFGE